jgi:hypothetical protein
MNFISNMLVAKPIKDFVKTLKDTPGSWAYQDVSSEVCGPEAPDLAKAICVAHMSGLMKVVLYTEKSGRKLAAFLFPGGAVESPKTKMDNDYLCQAIEDYLALPEDTPIIVGVNTAS